MLIEYHATVPNSHIYHKSYGSVVRQCCVDGTPKKLLLTFNVNVIRAVSCLFSTVQKRSLSNLLFCCFSPALCYFCLLCTCTKYLVTEIERWPLARDGPKETLHLVNLQNDQCPILGPDLKHSVALATQMKTRCNQGTKTLHSQRGSWCQVLFPRNKNVHDKKRQTFCMYKK